jgi:hypothetical protein
MTYTVRMALIFATLAACRQEKGGVPSPNFELDCHSSNTATAAELFCIRTDTRNGDVLRVMHAKLPTSNGPTAVPQPSHPGKFTTACDATSTDTRSDLYCVRLDTETGEMMLINLQKVAAFPPTP